MAGWLLTKDTNGRDFLLNIDFCIGIGQDEKGMALAVAGGGATIAIGETFAILSADLTEEAAP
jgi:hypothetical protein